MRTPIILAIGLWPVAFLIAFLGLFHSVSPSLDGEIVFERASTCDHVVVKTPRGYVMLEVNGAVIEIAGGNRFDGVRSTSGWQPVSIDGRAEVSIRVKGVDRDLLQAKSRFDYFCGPEPFQPGLEMAKGF